MRSRDRSVVVCGAVALLFGVGAAAAAPFPERPDVSLGEEISEAEIAAWNIDVQATTGEGLPPGEGTVAEGEDIYRNLCMSCHGEAAAGGPVYGPMVGGIGSMTQRPRVVTPGSMYPYAPILFDYIRRAMPMDHPQSLTADEIYAVSAYILHLNGLIEEDFVVNAETMPTIEMPNREAFIEDDRPDTNAERCMADCEPIGTVADAEKKRN